MPVFPEPKRISVERINKRTIIAEEYFLGNLSLKLTIVKAASGIIESSKKI